MGIRRRRGSALGALFLVFGAPLGAWAQGALQELGIEPGAPTPFVAPPEDATAAVPAARWEEASLLNRQWETVPARVLGGLPVHVSGLFTRDESQAYLVLYSKAWGRNPLLFNLLKLIVNEVDLRIGNTNYRVTVSPSLNRLNSTVQISPSDGESGGISMSLRELLQATYDVGQKVVVGGRAYRLFLINEVDGQGVQGKINPSLSTVILLRPGSGGEFEAFPFSHEAIPSDRVRYFPLEKGRSVGFRVLDGFLEVYSL